MKICIDPGHGMSNRQPGIFDPGATHMENGFRFHESAMALRYALAVKDALRARQIDVFMTRDDEQDHAPVVRRAAMAQAAGCDALISIHLNDAESDAAHGTEVLYRDDEALARRMQQLLVQATGLRDRGIKQRTDLAVLKFDGPAVLLELGFIANDNDRAVLLSPQIRSAVADGIASLVAQQVRQMEMA